MDKIIKTMWIEALKSGDYEQAFGCLQNHQGYCCLGVLCDLYKRETGNGQWTENKNEFGEFSFKTCETEEYAFPQKEVMRWAGLTYPDPEITLRNGNTRSLAQLNDEYISFKEIAEIIKNSL